MNDRGYVIRLYQWLSKRASFLRADSSSSGISRTLRTEVTVELKEITLLMGSGSADLDDCPVCGQKLAKLPVLKDSTSEPPFPIDSNPP